MKISCVTNNKSGEKSNCIKVPWFPGTFGFFLTYCSFKSTMADFFFFCILEAIIIIIKTTLEGKLPFVEHQLHVMACVSQSNPLLLLLSPDP